MFERGYLQIAKWRGVPLRVHWTTPIGAVVFGGLRLVPVFWVGFFLLVLVHEFGHAFVAQRVGARVLSVDVTGFGGLTRWSGVPLAYQRGLVAWAGVAAQAVLLAVAFALWVVLGVPRTAVGADLADVFIVTNLWLIGLNLLPFPPLDGAQAWSLAPQIANEVRSRWHARGTHAPRGGSPPSAAPPPRGDAASSGSTLELAEALRRVSEQAGEARRGGAGRASR
jgi:hypothetical protein